jgi:hypothetical protein
MTTGSELVLDAGRHGDAEVRYIPLIRIFYALLYTQLCHLGIIPYYKVLSSIEYLLIETVSTVARVFVSSFYCDVTIGEYYY